MAQLSSEARVKTSKASRYLGQLCKHFAHRVPVTFDPEQGRVEFQPGIGLLEACPEFLILRAHARDSDSLAQMEDILARHLERFAFREKPEIRWTRLD